MLDVPQESTEEDTCQAQQAPPRETPSHTPLAPVPSSCFHTPTFSMFAGIPVIPGAPMPNDVEPNDVEPNVEVYTGSLRTLVSENAPVDMEPGLFETDSELSPSLSQAIPTVPPENKLKEIIHNSIPAFLAMLRIHPEIVGNAMLEYILTNGEFSVSVKPPNRKRKVRIAHQTIEPSLENGCNTLEPEKRAFDVNNRPMTKRKFIETEQASPENASFKRICASLEQKKRVPVLFDEKGMLSLRAYEEVPMKEGTASDEETADKSAKPLDGAFSHDQQQTKHTPETPRPRGWALSSFLPSAQTVTRFLPSFSIRTPAIAPVSPLGEPTFQDQPTTPTPTAPSRQQREASPITPLHIPKDDHSSRSEPPPVVGDGERGRRAEYQPAATVRASRHRRHAKSKHGLKTKGEREEIRKRDEMIASLRAQLEAQNETQAQKEAQAEKAAQAQMDASTQIESETQKAIQQISKDPPSRGTKRKAESPPVIPNPPGGGFGMVLEYFGQGSDDDDDDSDTNMDKANVLVTPAEPPSKKTRLSGGPAPQIVGNPFRATPYTGKALALPPLLAEPGGPHDSFVNTSIGAVAENLVPALTDTPTNGPTMTFTVPSPSDSDDEWDGPSYVEPSRTPPALESARFPDLNNADQQTQASSTCTTQKQVSPVNATLKQSSPLTSQISEPNVSKVPSSHATSHAQSAPLFPSSWTAPSSRQASQTSNAPVLPNVALDKARQTALKHKPQQPSRLRESSRLSTSTVGTEVGGDEAENKTVENKTQKPSEKTLQMHETRDPYASGMTRQSSIDPILPETVPMPHESLSPIDDVPNVDGEYSSENAASDQDLPEDFPSFASFAEYEKTMSPRVKDFLAQQWTGEKAQFRGEAYTTVTEQFSEYEKQLDKVVEKPQLGDVSAEIHDYIASVWDKADDEAAIEKFDNDFETWVEKPIF